MNESEKTLVDSIARLVAGFNENPTNGSFSYGGQSHPVAPYAIVPHGFEVKYLDSAPVAPLPPHIIQTVTLNDTRSLVAYVNRFKQSDTTIFLDKSGKFVAVFDYHTPPAPVKDATAAGVGKLFAAPQRTAHRASFTLDYSEQWLFWAGLHDKWLTQQQAIEIFEGRRADITTPTDAELLKCAGEIRCVEGVEMVSRYERNSGQSVMVRKEQTVETANQETRVINDLVLSIPCFENGAPVDISVLINWNGKVNQFVKFRLLELDSIKRAQTAVEFEVVQAGTNIPVMLGTPQ
jgi:hypothetical protein